MSTNSVPVTLEEIEVSLNCTNELIDTMVKKKYAQDDTEKTYDDVIGRICRILTNRFGTTFAGIPVQDVLSILTDGYFIPGGSILAGLTDNNLGDKKSLSNCYALGIKNDSIEAICDCIKYACRTYSYRGGVGIDLTVLRPNGTKVNNAARTSSGAVSFMPMISQANATIGTNGRRAAMMMTMDIRHPDIFEFLWCKADPEGVFHRDHMAKDVTARYLKAYLSSSKDDIPEGIHDCLLKLADNGRLPDISTANISIKVSNEFMDLASDETYDKPWVTCFPDIDKDKELYDTKWNGNYDDWEACGGTLIHDYSHSAFITTRNYKRFIGRTLYVDRSAPLTEESILKLIEDNGGSAKVTLINPSPRQLLRELAEANHMRNDPGLLFWDKHTEWSLQSHLSPDLRPVTTNPCFSKQSNVMVADGRGEVLFDTLVAEGKDVPLYTRDPNTGEMIIRMGRNPRYTGFHETLTRVHFTDGSYQDVTHDHGFPLKDGREVEAKDLCPGDRLYAAVKTNKAKVDNSHVEVTNEKGIYYEHRLIYQFHNGDIPEGYVVHHKDHDATNNDISNLILMLDRNHKAHHANHSTNPFKDPEWQNRMSQEHHVGAKRNQITCKRISDKAIARCQDPMYRQKLSNAQRKAYNDNPHLRDENTKRNIDRCLQQAEQLTDLPLTVHTHPNGRKEIRVVRACEVCGDQFTLPLRYRERSCCSMRCSLTHPSYAVRMTKRREGRYQQQYRDYDSVRRSQLYLVDEMVVANNGIIPTYQEFATEATTRGIDSRIGGMAFGFGSWNKLLAVREVGYHPDIKYKTMTCDEIRNEEYASTGTDNHRVSHIETIEYNDQVCTITVDDTHTLFVMTRHNDTSRSSAYNRRDFVLASNCGEISGPVYFACNLGAHILHRYVRNPYMGDSYFDARLFYENCEKAMVLMNMFSLINEDMHPLQEQRDMEIYSRRIGIEFTGLGDMISMMGMKYGSGESIEFVSNLMHSRSQIELLTNIYLAKELGPCTAADPEVNSPGLTRVMVSDFYKKVVSQGNWDYFNNINRYSSTVESDPAAYKYPIHFTPRIDSFSDILKYGLRNSATSTVGPTGTLSIVSGYCSSGIEPVFDIFMDRKTRVGDVPSYQICHKALFDHVYAHMSEKNISAVSIEDIKSRYDVVVASELNYHARIAMQAGIQMTCDSSISSTINLPEDTTVDTLMDIYMEAYKKGLKGVTTYRDGSMDSVMSSSKAPTAKPNDAPVESNDDITYAYNDKGLPYTDAKDDIRPIIPTVSPSLARGVVMELPDVLDAKRHEVVWEGHKVYLIVPLDDNGFPVEIFVASLPFSVATDTHGTFSPNDYMHKLEMWNAITRLASIDLRAGVAPEVVVTQLQRSSASVCSLISIIARVLSLYAHGAPSAKSAYQHTDGEMQSHEVDSSKLAICPECGNKSLVYGGGCNQCISPECGYSKCM